MTERTFTIFKPDAVRQRVTGFMLQRLLDEGFAVLGMRMIHLSRAQAEAFYAIHSERPFFPELVTFMTSGPVIVVSLERENAVAHLRAVMGATDPAKADQGTVRAQFGTSIQCNAIHGSDSVENGLIETAFFFAGCEALPSRNAKNAAAAKGETPAAAPWQTQAIGRPPRGK